MPVLAINGGEKTRSEGWPDWPPDDPGFLENIAQVIDSKVWAFVASGPNVPGR